MGVYKLSTAGGLATPRTNYSSFLAGNPKFIDTSYESIATVTVGSGGASDVTFSSIPSTYTHLQIRALVQTDRGTYGIDSIQMQLNSDTGSNYATHWLFGDGAAVGVDNLTSNTYLRPGDGQIGTSTGNSSLVWGAAIIDFLDYQNTNKYKTVRALQGVDLNGTIAGFGGRVGIGSGVWMSTNAITSIKLYTQTGPKWTQYSSFALYGIKGA